MQKLGISGGLVVRILGFHYHGPGSNFGQGTEILQAKQHGWKEKNPETWRLVFFGGVSLITYLFLIEG